MTVILVIVYITLTRIIMWVFEDTVSSWAIRIFFIVLLNAAATYLMYDFIDDQFEFGRNTHREYYKRYDNLPE